MISLVVDLFPNYGLKINRRGRKGGAKCTKLLLSAF